MYKLSVDYTKCKGAEICEKLFPEFVEIYGRVLYISQDSSGDREFRLKATEIYKRCPNNAILFKLV